MPSMTALTPDEEALLRRLGTLEPLQVRAWQQMQPHERLQIAFEAYQFALEAVRVTERALHPNLSEEDLHWRVTRRMQGNPNLGPSNR